MTRSATGRGSSAPRPRPRRPPARSAHRTGKEGCAARGGFRLLGRNPAGAGRQPASVHQRRSKQALHQTAPQRARASRLSRQDARATKSGRRRDTGALGTEAAEGHALLGACLLARAEGLRPAARHGAATPAPPRATEHGRRGREQEEACRSASQGWGVGAAWWAVASEPRGRRRRCWLPCARPSGTPGVDALAPHRARSRAAPALLLRGLDGGRASPRLRILDEVGAELHARADLEITGRPDWSVFIVVLSWFSVRGLGGPPPFILVNRLDFGWFLMLYKRRLSICLPSRNLRFPESSNVEFCAKNVTRTQPRRALGGAGSRFPRAPGSGTRVGGHPLSAPRLLHVVIQLRRQMILTQHCRFPAEPANTPEPCKAARKYDAGRKR